MNRDITKLIEYLELSHEYGPKEVILQAAAELRGLQDRIHDLYVQLCKTEEQLDDQYKMGMEAEREMCAKVCDGMDHNGVMIAADCAAAIRARGNNA